MLISHNVSSCKNATTILEIHFPQIVWPVSTTFLPRSLSKLSSMQNLVHTWTLLALARSFGDALKTSFDATVKLEPNGQQSLMSKHRPCQPYYALLSAIQWWPGMFVSLNYGVLDTIGLSGDPSTTSKTVLEDRPIGFATDSRYCGNNVRTRFGDI